MLESKIQTSIKNHLQKKGWFITKLIQTSTNGIPDLLCLKDGRVVFLEIKQPGKNPTELQLFRIEQLKKNGFETIVATSKKDIEHL